MEIDKDRIAQAALDDPSARVVAWRVEPTPNPFGTATTESLERVHGIARINGEESGPERTPDRKRDCESTAGAGRPGGALHLFGARLRVAERSREGRSR